MGLNNSLNREECAAVLTIGLENVCEREHLQVLSLSSCGNCQMHWDPALTEPVGVTFSVLSRKVFHRPIFRKLYSDAILIDWAEEMRLPCQYSGLSILDSESKFFALNVMFRLCAAIPSPTSFRLDGNVAQRSHTPLWSWSHVAWSKGSFGSLKVFDLQWSATVKLWETWTYIKRLKRSYDIEAFL